ncbi:MAG: site-specific DNA-methyltransferase [bacterium]|nr:site-specific DNA-methyltransferase [bacterium]
MILRADALNIPLTDESVQCVVTSPPYWGLRDYGLEPTVWGGSQGCLPGRGHEWGEEIIGGEGYSSGRKRKWQHGADRDSDPEGWQKGTVQGQFCSLCSAWLGCLGLEPTPELYVEHIVAIFREVRRVLRSDGTVWLNLGDSYAGSWSGNSLRPEGGSQRAGEPGFQPLDDGRYSPRGGNVPAGLKPKDLVGIPWRVALALQSDGWWLRSDIIWSKPNPMPESVRDRPTRAHEYLFLLTRSARYFYDAKAIAEPWESGRDDMRHHGVRTGVAYLQQESAASNFNKGDRVAERNQHDYKGGRNRRSVWTIATEPYPGAHYATFPKKLVKPCVLAGSNPGDVVLDPFCGKGTTVEVAMGLGRFGIGLDLDTDLAAKELDGVKFQGVLL